MKISSLNKALKIKDLSMYKQQRNQYFSEAEARLKARYGVDVLNDVILSQVSQIVLFADLKDLNNIVLEVIHGNLAMLGFDDKPHIALSEILDAFDFNNGYAKVAGEKKYYEDVYNQLFNFEDEPNVTFPIINRNGKQWIRFNLVLVEGKKDLAAVFITDVTNFLVEEEALFTKTHHDSLTGLFNKYTFDYHFGLRHKNKHFHVLFLDLDDFKILNDYCGHQKGNEYLIAFTKILKAYETDFNRFYRIGGDEFVGLFFQREANVKTMVKEIIVKTRNLAKHFDKKTTVSIGVVKAEACEGIIDKADQLLYQIKAQGKDMFLYKKESEIKNKTE